ncbi:transposase family protein [Providencia rettgeri]|nr:transposase family protein [Providencia rettgeri]
MFHLKEERGLPEYIWVDNGPEFISDKLLQFCTENGVILNYIQQGKPQQNGFIERFSRSSVVSF